MKRIISKALPVILYVCLAVSCDICGTKHPEEGKKYETVVLQYISAFNNLSSDIREDVNEMCSGDIPGTYSKNVFLIFAHNTKDDRQSYSTKVPPCLIRATKFAEQAVFDTLKVFPDTTKDTDPQTMYEVMCYVRDSFPAKKYGMIFSSHGTGWLPSLFYNEHAEKETIIWSNGISINSIGAEYKNAAEWQEMDFIDFTKAIPMHLNFIILDACLMGGIEEAYELKDICDYMIASPTEILSSGLYYKSMAGKLFSQEPDLQGICEDYASNTSEYSIGLIDLKKLDSLASCCKKIFANHRSELDSINKSNVQPFYRSGRAWFYDLKDLCREIGADTEESSTLEKALKRCVLYEKHSNTFITIDLETCCGLSTYIPTAKWPELNTYYKDLKWNKATGLVK